MHLNLKKIVAGALLSTTVIGSYTYGTEAIAAPSAAQTVAQQGQAKWNVYLRSEPSTSGKVVGKVNKGSKVEILGQASNGWYSVKTGKGEQGFASNKYIVKTGSTGNSGNTGNTGNTGNSGNTGSTTGQASATVEKVIREGQKYLGTPYEFGSNRSTTTTFDCSDFVRHIYLKAAGVKLPGNSRTQGAWIKEKGTDVNSISQLKRGDLVFFMSYKGSSASNYAGLDKSKQRITHVAMYLGDNKLFHTYSNKSGGVHVGEFSSSWKNRFLFGGSVL